MALVASPALLVTRRAIVGFVRALHVIERERGARRASDGAAVFQPLVSGRKASMNRAENVAEFPADSNSACGLLTILGAVPGFDWHNRHIIEEGGRVGALRAALDKTRAPRRFPWR